MPANPELYIYSPCLPFHFGWSLGGTAESKLQMATLMRFCRRRPHVHVRHLTATDLKFFAGSV